jgi:hypothetical protein
VNVSSLISGHTENSKLSKLNTNAIGTALILRTRTMIINMKVTDDFILLSIATFTLFPIYIFTDFYTQLVPAL